MARFLSSGMSKSPGTQPHTGDGPVIRDKVFGVVYIGGVDERLKRFIFDSAPSYRLPVPQHDKISTCTRVGLYIRLALSCAASSHDGPYIDDLVILGDIISVESIGALIKIGAVDFQAIAELRGLFSVLPS